MIVWPKGEMCCNPRISSPHCAARLTDKQRRNPNDQMAAVPNPKNYFMLRIFDKFSSQG